MRISIGIRALYTALGLLGPLGASSAFAQSPNVVISSAYGGGGFNANTPLNDYVELFNRGTSAVDLTGWSVQVGTGTTTVTWSVIPLSGSIAAGGYYLVAVGIPSGGPVGNPLPTPDATASPLLDTSALTSPSGRIAVANTITSFSVACPVGQPGLVDFLGYGSVSCFEGAGPAPGGVSGSQMTFRNNAGCVDSDNNNLDFAQGWPPNPRSTATTPSVGGVFVTTVPTPGVVNVGSNITLSTTISGCTGPAPTITGVSADLSAFGLSSAAPLTDTAGTWSLSFAVPLAQPAAVYSVTIAATDGTTTFPGSTSFRVLPLGPSNDTCAAAQVIASLPFNIAVDNSGATPDIDPGTCNTGTQGNAGVWYVYTATNTGVVTVTETSTQDIASGVWSVASAPNGATDCAGFTATNGTCLNAETFSFPVVAGSSYYVQIGSTGTVIPTVPISATVTFSSAPINDICDTATLITGLSPGVPQPFTADNRAATPDLDPGTCNTGTAGNFGVWFRYDATQSGVLLIDETSTQTVAYGIWSTPTSGAVCPSTTPAPTCSTTQSLAVPVLAGTTYFVQIGSSSTTAPTVPAAGTFTFSPPPGNDTCDNATLITGLSPGVPQPFTADNRAATPDLDPGTCNTGTAGNFGVWFRYDATQNATLQLTETSSQTVAWGVWETPTSGAVCPSTSPAALLCTTTQSTSILVVAGNTYFIQLGSSSTTAPTVPAGGSFSILLPPGNENCSAATTIAGTGFFPIANLGAATGVAPFNSVPCPTTALAMNNDVWYRWVAPASGNFALITRQHPAPFTGRIALYDGGAGTGVCPTTATPIQCQSIGTAISNNASAPLSAIAGNVYFIQVASSTVGGTGSALLEIVQNPSPVGACCAGSACSVASSFACAALGGTYQGDGSFCSAPTATLSTFTGASGTIPDGSTAAPGIYSDTINVTDAFPIEDLEVTIDMNHTFQGDVFISLTKGTRTLVLSHRGRRGMSSAGVTSADFAGAYTFSDLAAQSVFDVVVTGGPTIIPAGSYKPASVGGISPGFKKTFNGVDSAGGWTLLIQDEAAGIAGTVAGWTLRLKNGTSGPCSAPATVVCCRGVTCAVIAAVDCTAPAGIGISNFTGTSCTGQSAIFAGCCYADFNKSGVKDVADIFAFLSAWFANSPFSDVGGDGTGTRDVSDIFQFLSAWFVGCT